MLCCSPSSKRLFCGLLLAALMASPTAISAGTGAVRMPAEAASRTSDSESVAAMYSIWLQDIQYSRENGSLCVCSRHDIAAAQQAICEAAEAATQAFAAQMDYAAYSLEPHRTTQPERYRAAMQQYRSALLSLMQKDLQHMRRNSVLTEPERCPEQAEAEENPFAAALSNRLSTWDTYRSDLPELHAHLLAQHLSSVQFMASLMAGDRPSRDFITNTQLDSAPEDYNSTCQAKFLEAHEAWLSYTDKAAQLHCPVRALQGNGTSAAISSARLSLLRHYEGFLTLIAHGLGR